MKNKDSHISVMKEEFLAFFADSSLKVFFEGTVGAAGHAKAILQAHPEIVKYIGCDKDPQALELARKELEPWKDKVELIQGDFSNLDTYLSERKILHVDGFFLIWECHLCN